MAYNFCLGVGLDSNYYKSINKAELDVQNEDFIEAKKMYDSLFISYERMFCKDVLVSCMIDSKCGVIDSLTEKKFEFLFKKGYSLKQLKRIKILKRLKRTQINRIKDNADLVYLTGVNIELRAEIHKLFKRDQKIRNGLLMKFFSNYVENQDSMIHYSYKKLTRENGAYIGEETIGISRSNLHCESSFYLTLHLDNELDSAFLEILKLSFEGYFIHPLEYAWILDRSNSMKNNFELFGTFFVWRKLPDKTQEKEIIMDRNRKSIFLDSIKEHSDKIRNRTINLIYII